MSTEHRGDNLSELVDQPSYELYVPRAVGALGCRPVCFEGILAICIRQPRCGALLPRTSRSLGFGLADDLMAEAAAVFSGRGTSSPDLAECHWTGQVVRLRGWCWTRRTV